MSNPKYICDNCGTVTDLDFDPAEKLYCAGPIKKKRIINKESGCLKWTNFKCPNCGKSNN